LDNLASYFNEKERNRLSEIAKASKGGLPEMSLEEIRLSCRENDGYDSPELNEKLYLHFRGFKKIENLDSYVSCKAIWLDSNGLEKIEGLTALANLRCLYLGKNLISRIEGLENLSLLTTLDLSNNRLTTIENLSCCPALEIVNFSRNAFASVEAISHLAECLSIENVDLTNNAITGDVVRDVFQLMPNLVALSLNGNPATQLPSFRKLAITAIPKLAYLDRPVDELERIGAEAFASGGAEAEMAAKEEYRERQKQSRANEMNAFREWQKTELERRKGSGEIGKRCYVSDFSEEELAQREAEAHKAAEDEKRMIALGVGKIGARYWQLQGSGNGSGHEGDDLQRAVDSLLEEEHRAQQAMANAIAEELPTPPSAPPHAPAVFTTDLVSQEPRPPTPPPLSDEEPAGAAAADIEEDKDEGEEEKDEEQREEEESQEVRDQRVAESVRIYLRQQEQQREKRETSSSVSSSLSTTPLSLSSTWDLSRATSFGLPRGLYWSEWMDLKLAEFVRSSLFDFAAVSASFAAFLSDSEFPRLCPPGTVKHEEMKHTLSHLSAEDCRLRWAELDASRWSVMPSTTAAAVALGEDDSSDSLPVATASAALASSVPVYRVCIQPQVLGKGHGAQPSFQAMSSMVAGAMPAYLKVPVAFPSTSEFEEPETGDDQEEAQDSLEHLD
jgi:hypothetical protein